jgi:hypothetical protein
LALVLVACSKPQGHETATEKLKASFDQARGVALVNYGLKTVTSKTNLTSLDCLVFNQAAASLSGHAPAPTELGDWSALTAAMRVRMAAGCAEALPALADYETARRGLAATWAAALNALPGSSRIEAEQGAMGKFITSQLDDVVTERGVCLAQTGVRNRTRRTTASMENLLRNCNSRPLDSGWAAECTTAWTAVAALDSARGPRTANVWLSELVERYKMAVMACSPTAAQEYVQFHQATPPVLFQGPAFRLAIPIDTLTNCTLSAVAETKTNPYRTVNPQASLNRCAKDMGFLNVFNSDFIPRVVSPSQLKATGDGWLFDPTQASLNPTLWTFNPCEVNLINRIRAAGINPASPKAIHRYCRSNPNG